MADKPKKKPGWGGLHGGAKETTAKETERSRPKHGRPGDPGQGGQMGSVDLGRLYCME